MGKSPKSDGDKKTPKDHRKTGKKGDKTASSTPSTVTSPKNVSLKKLEEPMHNLPKMSAVFDIDKLADMSDLDKKLKYLKDVLLWDDTCLEESKTLLKAAESQTEYKTTFTGLAAKSRSENIIGALTELGFLSFDVRNPFTESMIEHLIDEKCGAALPRVISSVNNKELLIEMAIKTKLFGSQFVPRLTVDSVISCPEVWVKLMEAAIELLSAQITTPPIVRELMGLKFDDYDLALLIKHLLLAQNNDKEKALESIRASVVDYPWTLEAIALTSSLALQEATACMSVNNQLVQTILLSIPS